MSDSIEIQELEYKGEHYATEVALRIRVLREPLGLNFAIEDLEEEREQFRLGAFDGETLVGCLLLKPLENGELKMRQVAVAPDVQGRGIGAQLVAASEALARERGFTDMVLSARDSAVGFYERLGYVSEGDPYEEVTIPHQYMRKRL